LVPEVWRHNVAKVLDPGLTLTVKPHAEVDPVLSIYVLILEVHSPKDPVTVHDRGWIGSAPEIGGQGFQSTAVLQLLLLRQPLFRSDGPGLFL